MKSIQTKYLGFLTLGLICMVVMVSGCTSEEPTATINETEETHPEAKNVVIVNSTGSFQYGYYYINGTVKNKNDFGVAYVKILARAYDKNGELVAENYTYASDFNLAPGAKSTFDFYLEDPDHKIVKYELKVIDADKSLYEPESKSTDKSTKDRKFPLVLPEGEKVSCPYCGSFNNIVTDEIYLEREGKYLDYFECRNCGYMWEEKFSYPASGTPA